MKVSVTLLHQLLTWYECRLRSKVPYLIGAVRRYLRTFVPSYIRRYEGTSYIRRLPLLRTYEGTNEVIRYSTFVTRTFVRTNEGTG